MLLRYIIVVNYVVLDIITYFYNSTEQLEILVDHTQVQLRLPINISDFDVSDSFKAAIIVTKLYIHLKDLAISRKTVYSFALYEDIFKEENFNVVLSYFQTIGFCSTRIPVLIRSVFNLIGYERHTICLKYERYKRVFLFSTLNQFIISAKQGVIILIRRKYNDLFVDERNKDGVKVVKIDKTTGKPIKKKPEFEYLIVIKITKLKDVDEIVYFVECLNFNNKIRYVKLISDLSGKINEISDERLERKFYLIT